MSKEKRREITYTTDEQGLTVRIEGAAFANLRRIASAMNTVEWCDNDNTVETVARNFVLGDILDELKEASPDILGMIESMIDTGFRDDTPEHNERIDALRRAFEAVGLYDD